MRVIEFLTCDVPPLRQELMRWLTIVTIFRWNWRVGRVLIGAQTQTHIVVSRVRSGAFTVVVAAGFARLLPEIEAVNMLAQGLLGG